MSRVRENRTHGSTGGSWKRSTLATDTEKNTPEGNPLGTNGSATYRQYVPPRQFPTQPSSDGPQSPLPRTLLGTRDEMSRTDHDEGGRGRPCLPTGVVPCISME